LYILKPYDDSLRYILENGELRKNRTGVDCLTVFSLTSTYDISEHFPLVTKRKLFPRAVFAELLWMLSGSTSNEDLKKLGCNFWTPWADSEAHPDNKAFYERTGFAEGYLGPVYGFQMRHFGGKYGHGADQAIFRERSDGSYADMVGIEKYEPGGVDQISWLVNEIKANPDSRRLIVSLWNPVDLPIMRLPPCHYCFHVSIDNDGRMSLLLNQRSCDFPVGVPANIQFYSALCIMLAQQTGYKPYRFVHHTEDAHIYVNQLDDVKEYLSREERLSPKIEIKKANSIFDYKMEDFNIIGYDPCPPIRMPVTV
jgi:thymidylate synthase